jgi:Carbohydrate-selective porin, OprB family
VVYLNFLDLFGKGNLGGIYVGQPPKITRSNLPVGNNLPDLINGGIGQSGGQPGTTTHIEAFYRWQMNSNVSITPGLIVILQPGHTRDSEPIFSGILRTTFSY